MWLSIAPRGEQPGWMRVRVHLQSLLTLAGYPTGSAALPPGSPAAPSVSATSLS